VAVVRLAGGEEAQQGISAVVAVASIAAAAAVVAAATAVNAADAAVVAPENIVRSCFKTKPTKTKPVVALLDPNNDGHCECERRIRIQKQ
jgi:hypothetical protein